MGSSKHEEPPSYQQLPIDSQRFPEQSRPYLIQLFQHSSKFGVIDPRAKLHFEEVYCTRQVFEGILLPPDFTIDMLHACAKERMEQRFTLKAALEEYLICFRIRLGRDTWSDSKAPRILLHEGNFEAVKALLDQPEWHLEAWFGEMKKPKNAGKAAERNSLS